MTRTLSLYEAKTQLSSLVEAAAAGDEIIITKHGKPKARIVPIPTAPRRRKVTLGAWADKMHLEEGGDQPLPEDVIAAMLGEDPDDPLNQADDAPAAG